MSMIRKSDPAIIRPYLEDASGMSGGHADAVLLPSDAREASDALAGCNADRVPVTLSGAGTGLTGGRIPFGGLVMGTDRMAGVRHLDPRRQIAVVAPATPFAEVERLASDAGLFLPPNPTETTAWIGGAVATNASGSRTFHYGPLRRFIRRLSLVLADGTELDAPRGRFVASGGILILPGRSGEMRVPILPGPTPPTKSATGYFRDPGLDLVDLIIGSEGTLAAVTEVELQLVPTPEAVLSGVAFFPTEESCWAAVQEIRRRTYTARGYAGPAPAVPGPIRVASSTGLLARALEYFAADALSFASRGGASIPRRARAGLLFEQEHRDRDQETVVQEWQETLGAHGALLDDSWIAIDPAARRAILQFRHALPAGVNEWLSRHGRHKYGTDLAVPDDALESMLRTYRDGAEEAGLTSVTFGHIGDNHLHMNLLPRDDAEEEAAAALYRRLIRTGLALGGTLSAEHGIGKLKAALLAETADADFLRAMEATKRALDPAWILGRGNLLPKG
jgi:D-lactate dehydrogenase (cytochrome)